MTGAPTPAAPARFSLPAHRSASHDALPDLAEAVRGFQDQLATCAPDVQAAWRMARQLRAIPQELEPCRVDGDGRPFGRQWHVPGRGQYLVPPYQWTEMSDQGAHAQVRFGQRYFGSGGALHGGAQPSLYEDAMDFLANMGGQRCSTVNPCARYRALTPPDTTLDLELRIGPIKGRKHFLQGWLRQCELLLNEAEGLFVRLREDQR